MIFTRVDFVNVLRGSHETDQRLAGILHTIQALDNVFGLDKVENLGLKFFGSGCEHSMVSERRLLNVGRAEEVDTAPGESP
jgi:hypothetical protein